MAQVTGVVCLCCGSTDTSVWAHARDVEYRTSDDDFCYRRCDGCGVLFLQDPPVDRLSEIYPPTYYSYNADGGGIVQRCKGVLDRRGYRALLRAIPGESLSLLDIGGGTGEQASLARAADQRVRRSVVVDLDPRCAAPAVAAGHEFVCSRIEDYQPDAGFDAVLMLNLIEHVADPRSVLRAVAGLLAPTGRILVKTPNTDALDARRYRHRSWGGYHCPRHWVLFDQASFADTVASSGLRVESLALTQGAPFWTVSVLAGLEQQGRVTRPPSGSLHDHKLFGPLAAAFAAFDFARRPFGKTSQMFAVLAPAS